MLHSNSPIDTSSYTTGTNVFNNQSKYHSFFTKLLFLAAEDVTKYWQSWHFRVVHRVSAQHLSTWFSFTSKKILFRGFRWNFRVTFNILRFSIASLAYTLLELIRSIVSQLSAIFSPFCLIAPCAKEHFSSGIPLDLPFSSLSSCFILLDLLLYGSTWMCKHLPLFPVLSFCSFYFIRLFLFHV